jgi:hypothetical protein
MQNSRDTYRSLAPPNSLTLATYALVCLALILALTLVGVHPVALMFIGATLFSWSEIVGLCGTSHVCALRPLKLSRERRSLRRESVAAYLVGGLITAGLVGAGLGGLGFLVPLDQPTILAGVGAAGSLLLLRELALVPGIIELPQFRRQTNKMWAVRRLPVIASAPHAVSGPASINSEGPIKLPVCRGPCRSLGRKFLSTNIVLASAC